MIRLDPPDKETDYYMEVFSQVLTLFVLMLCGFTAAKIRLVDEKGLAGLNALVLNFAQPALILASLQRESSPQLILDLAWTFLLTVVIVGISGLIAFRVFIRQPHHRRAVLTHLSMVSNCGFMGYPIITAAMGEEALIYAVVYVAAFQVMNWTLGVYFYEGRKALRPQALVTNPSLWAVVVGLVMFLCSWRFPKFINDGLNMLSGTTTPLAMFVIGARLITLRSSDLTDKHLLLTCVFRLVLFPMMALPLRLTGLNPSVVQVLFLCTAMPGAALTGMIADMYHSDSALASRGVALSTALSMGTIPLMLLLLQL